MAIVAILRDWTQWEKLRVSFPDTNDVSLCYYSEEEKDGLKNHSRICRVIKTTREFVLEVWYLSVSKGIGRPIDAWMDKWN